MAAYTVAIDGFKMGDVKGVMLKDWQIERMKRTFAKEWGISPNGINIYPSRSVQVPHNGKVS